MDKIISINVQVNCPVEKCWASWTFPEHIVNWNFASDDWCCPSAKNDVRIDGSFSWRMEAKDGSIGFDFEGKYIKVIDNSILEYTLGDGRPVKVVFEEENGVTTVTETFQGEDENALEMQKQGWQAILNNYRDHTEQIG